MTKKVKEKRDYYIEFSEEEREKLGIEENQKFSIEVMDDNSFIMKPFSKVDIDLSEFSRESLENLIYLSVEKDISVNEVISEILESYIEKEESK